MHHHRQQQPHGIYNDVKPVGSALQALQSGTLTGLARRNSDGAKMLVTNLHVMASLNNGMFRDPLSTEEMYQELVDASKKVGDSLAWVQLVDGQDNTADLAMCELEAGVDAEFILHDSPHSRRQVIEGVKEPTTGMTLTMMGAVGGEGTVTVKAIGETRTIGGKTFTGVVRLDSSQRPNMPGDSGSACLFKENDGRYRMACIAFARATSTGFETWAFPVSVAEREMGITFGVPKKEQLRDGIDLASKHLLRSTGPALKPNSSTGAIEEDWSTVVAGQTVGDAPIVCVVPTTGAITNGTPVTDRMGVTYTPVRLQGGLSAYKYFQPNNDHYAEIVESRIIHDRNSSPKTTTSWVRVKFIDKEQDQHYQDIMEMEVRKITRWGPRLTAPEFEYQAKVNRYGRDTSVPVPLPLPRPGETVPPPPDFSNARAVFLPDRLIENTSWTTIWKSGASEADLGPNFPQRAAAVPGLSPFTMLMSRIGAAISSVQGLASRAVGVNKFYAQNNVTFELFEGLGGYFDTFDDDVHFIHSDAMFIPGEKTQTEGPRYDWWWWPTRTGTPTTRRLYTTVHWPWKEGARSIEALYYLFKYADSVPPITQSNDDGIRHCYEWLKRSGFDGWGLERLVLTGALGDPDRWGGHTPIRSGAQTALSVPNCSKHWVGLRGYHTAYWADHLLRFAIACGWLYPALRRQGDATRANEVRGWLMKATDVLLALQLPWNGVFVDDEGNENCQMDVAGGLFSSYRVLDNVPRNCRYGSRLEEVATAAGSLFPGAQGQQGLVPSPHNSHYELSIGAILAFALAYHAVDDGHTATPANWPPAADAGNDQTVAQEASVTLYGDDSTDPDGDAMTYAWAQTAGPSVTLGSATAANPTFPEPS